MSVQITLRNGMGIILGITNELNLSKDDLKLLNKNGGNAIWTQVLQKAQAGQFTGPGRLKGAVNIAERDATNLSNREWKFYNGDVIQIQKNKFDEISQLINDKLASLKVSTSTTTAAAVETPEKTIKEEADSVKIRPLSSDATTVKAPEEQPLFATGKQLTRYVDGQKQTIEIGQNDNGQKTRYLVNKDGTRGEELVTMTTVGKNTYQTKSKFEADVKLVLGLGEKEEIPADLKPFYVEIGGEAQLMFKSPQGTLAPKQALALVKQNKSTSTPQTDTTQVTTGNTTNDKPETSSGSEPPLTEEQKTKWENSSLGKTILGATSKLDLSGLNLDGTSQTEGKDPLYAGNYNNQLMTNAGVNKYEIKQALDLFKEKVDIDTITSGTQKRSTITINGKDFTVIQTQNNIGVFSQNNQQQPIYLADYTPKNIQNSDSQLDQTRLGRGYGLNPAPSTTASTPTTPSPAPHSGSGETNPYIKTGSFSQSNTPEAGGQYWTKKSPYEE